MKKIEIDNIFDLRQELKEEVIIKLGPMSQYWNSLFEIVQILPDFIKSKKISK